MKETEFLCSDFPGDCLDEGAFHLEILDDPELGPLLLHVERRAEVVTVHFSADVDRADVLALVEAHDVEPVAFDPFAAVSAGDP